MAREYTCTKEIVNPGAVTVLQIAAGTSMPHTLHKVSVTQRTITTANQLGVQLVRKTAAATVTAMANNTDVRRTDPGDAASSLQFGTALTGHTATAEGTDGEELDRQGFDVRNGYYYEPQPEDRLTIPGGGIWGIKFSSAPPAGTYIAEYTISEGT
jgi:hypothetical protein